MDGQLAVFPFVFSVFFVFQSFFNPHSMAAPP